MIATADVIEFFDKLAPDWDNCECKNDSIIGIILDNAHVTSGKEILDVACGTGILEPYYLERKVANVIGIDISSEMAKRAKEKCKDHKEIEIICCDVENYDFSKRFDSIIVYNAFPHFPDAERLIECLSKQLKPEGYLTIAHGASREKIDEHHKGCACHVSNGLMEADELAKIFAKHLEVTTIISDDRMYQVVGRLEK
jgi:demethylmenaquinone methyltransferase/2-methoxy-6-polyprenyl-1,4-benzoquinol methylase